MPRLAVAVVLLALFALASTLSYTAYLVVGVLADYLDVSRVVTGLLLAVLFARLPWIREGKLRTIGLLPKAARRPVMASLLAFCLVNFVYRGDIVPALFPGFAITFLFTYPRIRRAALRRVLAPFQASPDNPDPRKGRDDGVIDVEVREKKD